MALGRATTEQDTGPKPTIEKLVNLESLIGEVVPMETLELIKRLVINPELASRLAPMMDVIASAETCNEVWVWQTAKGALEYVSLDDKVPTGVKAFKAAICGPPGKPCYMLHNLYPNTWLDTVGREVVAFNKKAAAEIKQVWKKYDDLASEKFGANVGVHIYGDTDKRLIVTVGVEEGDAKRHKASPKARGRTSRSA